MYERSDKVDLGKNILTLRKKLHLSQEKLGGQVGVTRQTISNWELNITIPDTNQLIALSRALKVSIDKLVDNDIQNLIEEKVNNVELEMMKNTKLLKASIFILMFVVALLLFVFISST